MRSIKARGSAVLALWLALSGFLSPIAVRAAESETSVLIMAPAGGSAWRKTVKRVVKAAELPYPYKLFFGSADTSAQVRELQDDINELEGDGAHNIVAIPLAISSYAPVTRQWKYVLGLGVQPGFINNPLFPVDKHASIQFMEPLNDSAVLVEILLDRAQEISRDPSKEDLVIVAYGPSDDSDNARWMKILQSLCARIKARAAYHSVEGFTLREEAANAATRLHAVEALRDRVAAIDESGNQALVVQLTLAPGGFEHKLALELRGHVNYSFNTKSILPDSRISEWIRSQLP